RAERHPPRPQRLALAEAPQRTPRLDESVLGGLFGFSGVLSDQHGGPEGDVLMRANERRIRVAIPVAGKGDQLTLGQRSSHHTVIQRPGAKGSTAGYPI